MAIVSSKSLNDGDNCRVLRHQFRATALEGKISVRSLTSSWLSESSITTNSTPSRNLQSTATSIDNHIPTSVSISRRQIHGLNVFHSKHGGQRTACDLANAQVHSQPPPRPKTNGRVSLPINGVSRSSRSGIWAQVKEIGSNVVVLIVISSTQTEPTSPRMNFEANSPKCTRTTRTMSTWADSKPNRVVEKQLVSRSYKTHQKP